MSFAPACMRIWACTESELAFSIVTITSLGNVFSASLLGVLFSGSPLGTLFSLSPLGALFSGSPLGELTTLERA